MLLRTIAFIYRCTGLLLFNTYVKKKFEEDTENMVFMDNFSYYIAYSEWQYEKGIYVSSRIFKLKIKLKLMIKKLRGVK